jgi:predicted nuclease of predicted toxin-antitoxin system
MFLANENFPKPSISMLREKGFAVRSIQEEFPGISDNQVIKVALEDNLIILTFDSDYGELIFKYAKENPPAVLYFRDKGHSPEFAGSALLSLLEKKEVNLSDAFTVVEINSIRQRFYKR